jgi:uncharacterized protein (TIGR03067 family)
MGVQVLTIFTVGWLIAADAPEDSAVKREKEQLQGAWQVVAGEVGGAKPPADELRREKLVIKGDQWTYQWSKIREPEQAAYELDPAKSPPAIDLRITSGDKKGKTLPGIYTVEGDTLKVCYDRTGKERPTAFETRNTQRVLIVFKRARP